MIASLSGKIKKIINQDIILDVGGVGYLVSVSAGLLTSIQLNQELSLFIHTVYRDDGTSLYGFKDWDEIVLFKMFLTVPGIGPRLAMAIFSVSNKDEIKKAIFGNDLLFFTQVPRLGKKNAQKIIIELKSKLGSLEEAVIVGGVGEEVVTLLQNFGFNKKEAIEAVRSITDKNLATEDLVKRALKYLGKGKG